METTVFEEVDEIVQRAIRLHGREAIPLLEESLIRYPDNTTLLSTYISFLAYSRLWQQALMQSDILLKVAPRSCTPYHLKSWVFFQMGRTQAAWNVIESAPTTFTETYGTEFIGGLKALRKADYETSVYLLRAAYVKSGNLETLLFAMAEALLANKQYHEVIELCNRYLLDYNPDEAILWLLARAKERSGDNEGAIAAYTEATRLTPQKIQYYAAIIRIALRLRRWPLIWKTYHISLQNKAR